MIIDQKLIPIHQCISIIQNYIVETKGVFVRIEAPRTSNQIELFLVALNVSCAYYGIQF